MRIRAIIIASLATGVALVSAYTARSLMEQQAPPEKVFVEVKPETSTIVIADAPLRYGEKLDKAQLREIEWPAAEVPEGAFPSISELFKQNKERYVLTALERNEPVLRQKITGPGQRATLSAIVGEGLRAITVRVNDVYGVAGFVLPGEMVDVLVTGEKENEHFVDMLVQNVRVLAVDQVADDRTTDPVVAKAVTLEVTADQSQKVALGAAVGQLSLVLRHASGNNDDATRRVTLANMQGPVAAKGAESTGSSTITIGIRRGMERKEYAVSRYTAMN